MQLENQCSNQESMLGLTERAQFGVAPNLTEHLHNVATGCIVRRVVHPNLHRAALGGVYTSPT